MFRNKILEKVTNRKTLREMRAQVNVETEAGRSNAGKLRVMGESYSDSYTVHECLMGKNIS